MNGAGDRSRTALHLAAFCGYASVIRALLKLGADPALRDAHGATAADLARAARKPAALRALANA